MHRKHGLSNSAEYRIWRGMLDRCSNPKSRNFVNYGARGIVVCRRWRDSVATFVEDMGWRPSPSHSLDRIDNNGDYVPSNCRWASSLTQGRNRRTSKGTKRLTVSRDVWESIDALADANELSRQKLVEAILRQVIGEKGFVLRVKE